MEQQILNVFIGQGAWCLLCVIVLYYNSKKSNTREDLREERYTKVISDNRKDSKERESKYQETINKNQEIINDLAKQFNVMKDVKEDVEQIKEYIFK